MRQTVAKVSDSTMSFKWTSMDQTLGQLHVLSHKLTKYVETCRAADVDWDHRSMATDNGDSMSLPLQFSITAFPDNAAFVNIARVGLQSGGWLSRPWKERQTPENKRS